MPSFFIILEEKIPNLDVYVNGNLLPQASEKLERMTKKIGVKSQLGFFSMNPEELTAAAEDHGMDVSGKGLKRPEKKWLSPEEGSQTVRSLAEALAGSNDALHARLVSGLREFEHAPASAQANGVRWHLGIDY